jgi:hypothetical protein
LYCGRKKTLAVSVAVTGTPSIVSKVNFNPALEDDFGISGKLTFPKIGFVYVVTVLLASI